MGAGLSGTGQAGTGNALRLTTPIPVIGDGSPGQVLKLISNRVQWAADNVGIDSSAARTIATSEAETAVNNRIPAARVPPDLTGHALQVLRVNQGATALEWTEPGQTVRQVGAAIDTKVNAVVPEEWRRTDNKLPILGAPGQVLTWQTSPATGPVFQDVSIDADDVLDAVMPTRDFNQRNKVIATGEGAGGENTLRFIEPPEVAEPHSTLPTAPTDGQRVELTVDQADVADPAAIIPAVDAGQTFVGWLNNVGKIDGPVGMNAVPPRTVATVLPGIDAVYYRESDRRVVVLRSAGEARVPVSVQIAVGATDRASMSTFALTRVGADVNGHVYQTTPFAVGSPPLVAGRRSALNVVYRGTPNVPARPNIRYPKDDVYVFDGVRWVRDTASATTIRDRLETLHGDDRLDASAIKNFPADVFVKRLARGPGTGITIAAVTTSQLGPITRFESDETQGTFELDFDEAGYRSGEIHFDLTLHMVSGRTTLGLRNDGDTETVRTLRYSQILFVDDVRNLVDFVQSNASSDGSGQAQEIAIARPRVYDGTQRGGRLTLALVHDGDNKVGYRLRYGTGGNNLTGYGFAISVDVNASFSPTDAPTDQLEATESVQGTDWARTGLLPTQAYAAARPGVIEWEYDRGRTDRLTNGPSPPAGTDVTFTATATGNMRSPVTDDHNASRQSGHATVDLREDAPPGTIGMWVVSQVNVANASGVFSDDGWKDVHSLFFPWGVTGFDTAFPTSAPNSVPTRGLLVLQRWAASGDGQTQQASLLGVEFAVQMTGGQTNIGLYPITGSRRPATRVTDDSGRQGAPSGGRLARYRVVVRPATLSVELTRRAG